MESYSSDDEESAAVRDLPVLAVEGPRGDRRGRSLISRRQGSSSILSKPQCLKPCISICDKGVSAGSMEADSIHQTRVTFCLVSLSIRYLCLHTPLLFLSTLCQSDALPHPNVWKHNQTGHPKDGKRSTANNGLDFKWLSFLGA